MIMKYINRLLHIPRLNHSRIELQVLLDHTLHGNGSICSRKWLYLGERIAEEDTDDNDSMESYPGTASTEYSDISTVDYNALPPDIETPGPSIPPSPLHNRSGKAKKTKKDRVWLMYLVTVQVKKEDWEIFKC